MEYPKEIPFDRIDTHQINDIWLPSFPKHTEYVVIYCFHKAEKAFYIGKTINKCRDRLRWHYRNTLEDIDTYGMQVDLLLINPNSLWPDDIYADPIKLEYYEALAIRALLPVLNTNVAKTWRRLNGLADPTIADKHKAYSMQEALNIARKKIA